MQPRDKSETSPAHRPRRASEILGSEILDGSPTSVRTSPRMMAETRGIPEVIDAVTHPSAAIDDLMASEDTIEGLTAFAAKRPSAGTTGKPVKNKPGQAPGHIF
jgi:acetyl-CoA C-acetyltransferase